MIEILMNETKEACRIDIVGHAGYAPAGQDIVCSAVSALWFTLTESLIALSDSKLKAGENPNQFVEVYHPDKFDRILIDSFRLGVHAIQEEYPGHVDITDNIQLNDDL